MDSLSLCAIKSLRSLVLKSAWRSSHSIFCTNRHKIDILRSNNCYCTTGNDCVQSDIRAFGIAGDWKATAFKAEVWAETVTESERRFMAAWRKEEVDAARHRQEKREATRLGKLFSHTEAYNFAKQHPLT